MKFMLMLVVSTIMAATACKQAPKDNAATTGEPGTYACPMKCEGEKTYTGPGSCPVCGMDLVRMEDGTVTATYEVKLTSMPETISAGTPTKLSFLPRKMGDPTTQVPLDEVHEHKIHVIVVSDDLGWYSHIHPEYQADGSYTVDQIFPSGGEYIIFSDFQPTGAANQVYRTTLTVNGDPKPKVSFTSEDLTDETDGYTVKLIPQSGKFVTNNLNHMGVEVTEKGKPVTTFESIMGAKGHLVIISGDGQKYLHVHPDEVEGKLDLHTQFEQPGLYRAYFQFQTNGKLHTSYFTLDVREGKPGEVESHDKGHDHSEGNHSH